MNGSIITIGDELLIGQVVNTNQAYIAERLNDAGVAVVRMTTVGDSMSSIIEAFRESWETFDIVVVTGGLGPTHDDITKKAVCTFFDSPLEKNEQLLEHIKARVEQRKIPWLPTHEEQALFPSKGVVIPNPRGTAAGIQFDRGNRHFFVLPGVPYEMKTMIDQSVVPFLLGLGSARRIRHRTLRTTGATESFLASQIGPVEEILHGATLAFLPSPTGVRLRISVESPTAAEADRKVEAIEATLRSKIGRFVYGVDEEDLEAVIGRLLTQQGATIAVAESCTGGHIADRLTNISGSSAYFERGVVTYSNASKVNLLGVPEDIIARDGAVSESVAVAMAEGVRRIAGTNFGVSTTGIAGPTGGSAEKPVGLVWIGFADGNSTVAKRFQFGDDRMLIKERSSQAALEMIWRRVSGTM